jgi:hypothetical protein
MAMAPTANPGTAASGAGSTNIDAPELRLFVMALFFLFGGITALNDVIIPKLKELFTLNFTQAMLVQFCFFTAYLVIGIPGAALVKRIGYMRGAAVGLLTMMAGCLLFIPVPVCAVHSRQRCGDRAGRLQPADFAARPRAHGQQPADVCARLQLTRHRAVSARRGQPDPRHHQGRQGW